MSNLLVGFFTSVLALGTALALPSGLDKKVTDEATNFKKQTASLQQQMLEIEKIALDCEPYKDRIEEELVKKSTEGRRRLDMAVNKMNAAIKKPTTSEALVLVREIGTGLQASYNDLSDAQRQKDLRFVLTCARPGNPAIEKKADRQLSLLGEVLNTQKRIESLLK